VREARTRGYAESTGEVVPNCTGISVPVVSQGRCDASVGVVFPTGRARQDEDVVAALRSAAEEIAAVMG
jgi:DNA-binding IclR family transcriptional regulator